MECSSINNIIIKNSRSSNKKDRGEIVLYHADKVTTLTRQTSRKILIVFSLEGQNDLRITCYIGSTSNWNLKEMIKQGSNNSLIKPHLKRSKENEIKKFGIPVCN